MATKIMLIRHAEKPDKDGSIRGVDETGAHDPSELSIRGWQRAGALVRFFAPPARAFSHPALATPDVIFACSPNDHAKSVRSAHTVELLARFLNQDINLDHSVGAEEGVARAASASHGVVLIAWEHDALPDIAAAIVGDSHTCPAKWPDPRFDLVWVLDRKAPGWTLTQTPQLLLPGDQADTIPLTRTGRA